MLHVRLITVSITRTTTECQFQFFNCSLFAGLVLRFYEQESGRNLKYIYVSYFSLFYFFWLLLNNFLLLALWYQRTYNWHIGQRRYVYIMYIIPLSFTECLQSVVYACSFANCLCECWSEKLKLFDLNLQLIFYFMWKFN